MEMDKIIRMVNDGGNREKIIHGDEEARAIMEKDGI